MLYLNHINQILPCGSEKLYRQEKGYTMSIKLFIMTHKPFTPPADPIYVPLQVGRANAPDLGFLGDDTGDSISSDNPYFCELTGMYWLWKNYHIGICHYRRYLINEEGSLFTEFQLEKLFREYDMITTKLLTLTCSYYQGFGENHHRKDLILTGKVLKEKYPEYTDFSTWPPYLFRKYSDHFQKRIRPILRLAV